MSDDEFQQRLERLGHKQNLAPEADTTQTQATPGMSIQAKLWRNNLIFGFLMSVVVFVLFVNVQNISDLAPQSVKEGPTPGLWGAPIIIITLLWFTVIPSWFGISVVTKAIRGKSLSPGPFVSGAMLGMVLGLGVVSLMSGPL